MNENRIKSAETIIKNASILRLCITAGMAFMWAFRYADKQENLIRIHRESYSSLIIALGFILDLILTISWLKRPTLHTAHVVLYIMFGGIIYIQYFFDYYNALGYIGLAAFGLIFFAAVVWVLGLIPFIVCGIGRSLLTKAKAEQEQVRLTGDKNEIL